MSVFKRGLSISFFFGTFDIQSQRHTNSYSQFVEYVLHNLTLMKIAFTEHNYGDWSFQSLTWEGLQELIVCYVGPQLVISQNNCASLCQVSTKWNTARWTSLWIQTLNLKTYSYCSYIALSIVFCFPLECVINRLYRCSVWFSGNKLLINLGWFF